MARMTFSVTMNMKQAFFDRQAVINAVDRVEHRAMSKGLAFIRTRARRDVLRKRKKVSSPGSPPSVRTSHPVANLRNIWFAYDKRRSSGVVGPLKLNQVNMTARGNRPVPSILEFGGTVSIQEQQWKSSRSDRWFRRDGRSRRNNSGMRYRTRAAQYKPRPFMSVAMEKEIAAGNVLSAWANVVGA